ncbi:MAG TPA: apolipoprotein N-acyltransferase, partial [Mycobacterium sp.]|nr:apolipoprotein N-acyltransferase [Mycobacterium sp.]
MSACRQRVRGWAAALAAGALPALAFPAPSWWWLAWFGVVPLLLVVRGAPSASQASVRAWWGLGGFVLTNQHWLVSSIGPLVVPLAIGLG